MKLHINDDVYAKLKELAEEQNRSVANMAETILLNVWGKQPLDPVERKKYSPDLGEPTVKLQNYTRTEKRNVLAEPTKEALDSLVPKSSRFDGPLCKIHGLPLDGRGKCLQKGCKYAR